MVDQLTPDIVLLDVRMPGIDGLEVARHLADAARAAGGHLHHRFRRIRAAGVRFRGRGLSVEADPRREAARRARQGRAPVARRSCSRWRPPRASRAHRSHIGVRGRDGLKLIPIEEVFCFQADQKYTTVKHLKGEDLIEDSLKTLEEEFAASFVRIHRNALVNTQYLERIARDASGQHFVHLRGLPDALEVSRRMAGDLKDRFRI